MDNKKEREEHRRSDVTKMVKCRDHEAEVRFQSLFEQSPFGIVIINTRGKIIEFNKTAHQDHGYSREEFAKLDVFDIDPFQSPGEIRASLREVLKKGELKTSAREVISNLVYWLVIIMVLVMPVNALGLPQASIILESLFAYIPNVIAALLVLVVAMFLSTFVSGIFPAKA